MLRIIQSSSAASVKNYYSTADYYTEGQELTGIWRGKGAVRLGLTGNVEQKAWDALCDNRDPNTGHPLTARRRDNRSIAYDFNFHVPKSVSLLYGLTRDERLLAAFRESVDDTMRLMEAEMKTRVRKDGKNEDRTTSNMIWGEFTHFTSRPVDGIPDPHLHVHAVVFNGTFDEKESRWKAGQFRGLKQDAPYFEAVFHSKMARRVAELGLSVERTKKGWEIAGISKASLDKFSRRTALIEEKAREQGITDAAKKSELGATTRERKQKQLSMDELREEWRSRLLKDERSGIESVGRRVGETSIPENLLAAEEAAILAVDHCFDRKSVLPERTLLAEAIRRSLGQATVATVEKAMSKLNLIIGEREGRRLATTSAVLAEEKKMIDFARQGRGSRRPLNDGTHVVKRDWLNNDQRKAVQHVLGSRDGVILVKGGAGVGKTSMMQEAVEGIEEGGTKVFTFAPSADASRGVLRNEGFKDAETVARLLVDKQLHEELRGQTIWIDEAGLMGTRTTAQVFDLAEKLDARLILAGDDRQHGSITRGATLRLLETEAGLVPAEIKEIQRQKGAYKSAVHALSEGRTADGFQALDDLKWVKEFADEDRYQALASDYVSTVMKGKSALVVSPTHAEASHATNAIRSELRRKGKLGREERQFETLENAHLTQAEKRDFVNYQPGADVLVFHQNAKGFKKGQRVMTDAEPLPLDQADRFTVFHKATMPIAPGEFLRITHPGKTADAKHRLDNGSLYTVRGFTKEGDIRLTNGWTIAKDFGHLAPGFVFTSYAAQGKTVQRAFVVASSISHPATSQEMMYVASSRAKESVTIFTDDKHALLDAVRRSDNRLTATEFTNTLKDYDRVAAMNSRQQHMPIRERDGNERKEMTYDR